MAIREEHDFLSENERKFLFESIYNKPNIRADGRTLLQQRKIRIQFRRSKEESQAEVQIGRTRVLANVHGEIVPPFPDRPTEGFLYFNVELSPMASQNFDNNRPSPLANELARVVERGIRDCRALDTESLAIVAGERVWSITVTLHVLDHGGNLTDCISLAAIAAMLHFRRPDVSISSTASNIGLYSMDDHAGIPLSLHHIPITITFAYLGGNEASQTAMKTSSSSHRENASERCFFMDPTEKEERITDGFITFTFNSFRELCAVHKIGGTVVSTIDVMKYAHIAAAKAEELTIFLKKQVEIADKEAIQQHRAMLRGQQFKEEKLLVSSTYTEKPLGANMKPSGFRSDRSKKETSNIELEAMTDFASLHQVLPLREGLSKSEILEKEKSMAKALASLELIAVGNSDNLIVTDDARKKFQEAVEATAEKESEDKIAMRNVEIEVMEIDDSDSDEETSTLQSEFQQVEVSQTNITTLESERVKDKKVIVVSSDSDSDDDEIDLSAAIKRKPHK